MNPYDKINDPMRWQAYEEGADSRDDEVATLKAQLDAIQADVGRLIPFAVKIAGAEMPVGQGPRNIQIFGDFIEAARKAIFPAIEPEKSP